MLATLPGKNLIYFGEMPEWLNGAVSKTVVQATVPRVRIPLSPPSPAVPIAIGIGVGGPSQGLPTIPSIECIFNCEFPTITSVGFFPSKEII